MSRLATDLIHPSAVVHPGARLGASVRVGPYCIIGGEVEIEEGCELIANIYMEGPLRVGPGNRFFPYSSIGVAPQDKKFHGERTETVIGRENTIREFVTVHRGTELGGGVTRIGDHNLIMAYAHIAHDCSVGNHTVLANGVTLGGHVTIEDYAVLGAFCGIHQFCRIGRYSLAGAYTPINQDVLPFSMTTLGREAKVYGINKVGLERLGFSAERRQKLTRALRLLSRLNTSQALEKIREEAADSKDLRELVRFVESSERGIVK